MYRFVVGLLQPSLLLFLLSSLGLLNLWRQRRETRRRLLLATLPFAGLLLLCTPAISYLARGSLEWHYPLRLDRPADADAIVVVGGYIIPPSETQPKARLGWDSLIRCWHAADLYQQGAPCPVVVTGGKVDPRQPGPSIAETMSEFLGTQGVPENVILVESESSTTFENALETRKLLRDTSIHKIVVVTDALHLPRATMCFQAQGFDVIPAGCNYMDFKWSVFSFLPQVSAAGDVQRAAHEWLGITYYWMRGRI